MDWKQGINKAVNLLEIEQLLTGYFKSTERIDIEAPSYEEAHADANMAARRFISKLKRSGGNLLASKLARGYERYEAVSIIGQSIKSPRDAAIIGQVYRNPSFETFRIIFVRKKKVIHHQGVTSRMPSASSAIPHGETVDSFIEKIRTLYNESGADGYYLLHNHPSGQMQASPQDVELTKLFKSKMRGFKGHVIVNHNKYLIVDKKLESTVYEEDLNPKYDLNTPSIPHEFLGREMNESGDVVDMATDLKLGGGVFVVIGRDARGAVSGIMELPLSVIVEKDKIKLLAQVREFARITASAQLLAANIPESGEYYEYFKDAFVEGVFLDVITKTGLSINGLSPHPGRNRSSQYMGAEMKGKLVAESLPEAAREAMGHEEATKAMKESGNYRKGHCRIAGFDVTIEQPAGSYREGVDPDGTPWKTRMNHHYGFLKKTVGADGDHVDAFFNPDIADEEFENMPIFVIDQIDKEGKFDEHKIMFGMTNKQEAKAAYVSNYSPGWEGLGDIHQFDVESFKAWVMDKAKTKKPVSSAVFEAISNVYKLTKEQLKRFNDLAEKSIETKITDFAMQRRETQII